MQEGLAQIKQTRRRNATNPESWFCGAQEAPAKHPSFDTWPRMAARGKTHAQCAPNLQQGHSGLSELSKRTLERSSGPAQIRPCELQRDHCTTRVSSLLALKRADRADSCCSFGDIVLTDSLLRKLGRSSMPLDRFLTRAVAGSLFVAQAPLELVRTASGLCKCPVAA